MGVSRCPQRVNPGTIVLEVCRVFITCVPRAPVNEVIGFHRLRRNRPSRRVYPMQLQMRGRRGIDDGFSRVEAAPCIVELECRPIPRGSLYRQAARPKDPDEQH